MRLSRNFSLAELTKSSTAERLGIDNTPNEEQTESLLAVATHILQPVRDHYGIAFAPSSGFRCFALNRQIGSKDTSQHPKGEAVDFEVPGITNYDLAMWMKDTLEFDKLILEFYTPGDPNSGWVHCSYRKGNNRGETYTYHGGKYVAGLIM